MFLDKVDIKIKAGNGGNGHVSFFRDKLSANGGPDGGDGGRGGNVVFRGTTREDNLVTFRFKKKFYAGDGEHGSVRNRFGKGGEDVIIPVPLGTSIIKDTGEVIYDITADGEEFVALKGGGGGRGNQHFATAKKRSPNFAQHGHETKEYTVTLELNTIADIGLVGFPNVGKSTLLANITRATPKIGNYHFTTIHPNIGVTNIFDQNIVIADIPGLIEGAADGTGLGHDFLKHISRTRMLIHVIDISESEGRTAIEDFKTINNELASYSNELANKKQVIALNKIDDADQATIDAFIKKHGKKYKIFPISAAIGEGTTELIKHTAGEVMKLEKPEFTKGGAELEEVIDKNMFVVEREGDVFYVAGPAVDNIIRGTVLTDSESNRWFQNRLVNSGIIAEMKERGLKYGHTVVIGDVEFDWID